MKPVIAIPSYKRSHRRIFKMLENIPLDKYVFVRPEDYEDYKSNLNTNVWNIVSIPESIEEIGETRAFIVDYFDMKVKRNWVFMFDDDIQK
jgi:hypothetical protein